MLWKDYLNTKFKTVKKDNRYLLFRYTYKDRKNKYILEVEGKENILKYIKNNGLTPYKEDQ